MPCKIYLRHDQSSSQKESSKSENVFVFAPSWVREGVNILGKRLKGIEFQVFEKPSAKRKRDSSAASSANILETFKITEDFANGSLIVLQKIARNEPRNANGAIQTGYYSPDIKDNKLIYSIKDLCRQCVIVGKDSTTHSGGYKSKRIPQPHETVYICDLAALQFQKPWNSGRLVLIQEAEPYKGPLDDLIFENVVGEKKRKFSEIVLSFSQNNEDVKKRYLKHDGYGKAGSCFLDTKAYKKFVEHDVMLTGLALAEVASQTEGDKLNFKFLKYGTGYFAGKFAKELNSLILSGVVDGMKRLFGSGNSKVLETIKSLEFPFYAQDKENIERLNELKSRFNLQVRFSSEDALKQTMKGKGLLTATTNCADSNVACGNVMGFKAVDGCISENLTSKGNIFCPNMNSVMQYRYINF